MTTRQRVIEAIEKNKRARLSRREGQGEWWRADPRAMAVRRLVAKYHPKAKSSRQK